MGLNDLGKWMLIIGLVIAAVGGLLWLLGRIPFLGNLPGDIRMQNGNFGCFVPLGTMLLFSLILTVLLNIALRLLKK
ncbi:MAG TPA: DUF2905 domain-containing protein [Anaerolineae bacterium]|nr:DUF2905 domain-containing protein [Anaerolineae bacterium]